MKKRFIVVLVFVFLLLFQTPGQADWQSSFEDMLLSNSHYSNVHYLADEGIIKGYPVNNGYDGRFHFKPSDNVTKRQVATMLVRALKLEHEKVIDPGFQDVTKKDSAYDAIAIAVMHGFFKKGTHFKPGASITREEMAYVLVRAFHLTGESDLVFSDVPKNHTAYKDVQALAANYITTGNEGKFNPTANLTRAQFATFLTRALLPESRPMETKITQGLLPEVVGKKYVYNVYYSETQEQLTFDKIEIGLPEFERSIVISQNVEDNASYIGYFEMDEEMQLESSAIGIARIILLSYPLTANASYTFDEFVDEPDYNINSEIVTHHVTVLTVNGLYKTDKQLFTDVIILQDEMDKYGGTRRCFISKKYGLIAVELGDSLLELDRIEY